MIGYKSLPLAGLTAFIMGLVLTMQLHPAMAHMLQQDMHSPARLDDSVEQMKNIVHD